MAVWEPVGGVFWSAPPNALDDVWSYWPVIPVLLAAAAASREVWKRIKAKRQQPEWHLRQHMVEIGTAITSVYLFAMFVLVCARSGQVLTMPLNEVGDFLAGAFGPVAFLWLVLGFLQQGEELKQGTKALLLQAEELKNSVEQQSIMATAATQQIEAQRAAMQLQLDEADRQHRANFTFVSSSRSGNGTPKSQVTTGLEVSCMGADAYDVEITFEPPIGAMKLCKFDSVSKGRNSKIPLSFENAGEDILGVIALNYKGSDGKARQEKHVYEIAFRDPWVRVKNRVAD